MIEKLKYKSLLHIMIDVQTDITIMELTKVIEELTLRQNKLPIEALKEAANRKDEIIPYLVKSIQDACDNYENVDRNNYLPIHAVLLLSQFKTKESHELICKLMRLPCSEESNPLDGILDIVLTECMHNVLAHTYNGDISHIRSIIEESNASVYARGAAIVSMILLMLRDVIPKDATISYLKSLFEINIESYDLPMFYSLLIHACNQLEMPEFEPWIKQKYEQDLVDVSVVPIERMTHRSENWTKLILNYSNDPVEILGRWRPKQINDGIKREVIKKKVPVTQQYSNIPRNRRMNKRR
jgi:hypothetical protein